MRYLLTLLFGKSSVTWWEVTFHHSVERGSCVAELLSPDLFFRFFLHFVSELSFNHYASNCWDLNGLTSALCCFVFSLSDKALVHAFCFKTLTMFLIKPNEIHSVVLHQGWPWMRSSWTPRGMVALLSVHCLLLLRAGPGFPGLLYSYKTKLIFKAASLFQLSQVWGAEWGLLIVLPGLAVPPGRDLAPQKCCAGQAMDIIHEAIEKGRLCRAGW